MNITGTLDIMLRFLYGFMRFTCNFQVFFLNFNKSTALCPDHNTATNHSRKIYSRSTLYLPIFYVGICMGSHRSTLTLPFQKLRYYENYHRYTVMHRRGVCGNKYFEIQVILQKQHPVPSPSHFDSTRLENESKFLKK